MLGFDSLTGGGGFSGSSGVTDQSSTAATSGTGVKNIGIGANPNAAARAVSDVLQSPVVIGGLLLLAVIVLRKK